MVPKLIGTKDLQNQQYIGQTAHRCVHIDKKMNLMHISSNLRLGGVSPIYWVKERKKESMPRRLHEVNMHAQYFQEPIPIDKKKKSEEKIPNE